MNMGSSVTGKALRAISLLANPDIASTESTPTVGSHALALAYYKASGLPGPSIRTRYKANILISQAQTRRRKHWWGNRT